MMEPNARFTFIMQLVIICFNLAHISRGSNDWNTAVSTLPKKDSGSVIGYDIYNQIIWIFGGGSNEQQLVSFNVTEYDSLYPFTDHGYNYLPIQVRAASQSYAQSTDTLYIISIDGTTLHKFEFASHTFTPNWKNIEPAPGRPTSCMVHINGYLIIAGGHDNGVPVTRSVQIYNISGDEWLQNVADMAYKRKYFSCYGHGDFIYMIGGNSNDYLDSVEKLYIGDMNNIQNQSWIILKDKLSSPKTGTRAVMGSYDRIYIVGGSNGTYKVSLNEVDVIHTITDTITVATPLMYGALYTSAIATENRIFVFGGVILLTNGGSSILFDTWQYREMEPPTENPTSDPTLEPTVPSIPPTLEPSVQPSIAPTSNPLNPSNDPSEYPTESPRSVNTEDIIATKSETIIVVETDNEAVIVLSICLGIAVFVIIGLIFALVIMSKRTRNGEYAGMELTINR